MRFTYPTSTWTYIDTSRLLVCATHLTRLLAEPRSLEIRSSSVSNFIWQLTHWDYSDRASRAIRNKHAAAPERDGIEMISSATAIIETSAGRFGG